MKPIKITTLLKSQLFEKFKSYIDDSRFSDTSITFKADIKDALPTNTEKPIINCTPTAMLKMIQLCVSTDTEIAWHGLVTRNANIFLIEDIIMYPQYVTGATVTTADESYAKWLMEVDDASFNKLRLQGHSHVNFGVTPSSTDTEYYNTLLQNLSDDDFYIFMIMNKKNEVNIWLYDLAQNIIFEKEDITLSTTLGTENLKEWAAKEKENFIIKPQARVTNLNKELDKPATKEFDYESWRRQYYGADDPMYASDRLERVEQYGYYGRGRR